MFWRPQGHFLGVRIRGIPPKSPFLGHFWTLLGPIIGGVFNGIIRLHGLSLWYLTMCIYKGVREGVKNGVIFGHFGTLLRPIIWGYLTVPTHLGCHPRCFWYVTIQDLSNKGSKMVHFGPFWGSLWQKWVIFWTRFHAGLIGFFTFALDWVPLKHPLFWTPFGTPFLGVYSVPYIYMGVSKAFWYVHI